MLEANHRDGHARILAWTPDETTVSSPGLVWPSVSRWGRPDWVDIAVAQEKEEAPVTLLSQGTWFHPEAASGQDLEIPALRPEPTAKVQTITLGELGIWHDAGGWTSEPKRAVEALIDAKRQLGPGRILWAPGVGTPADYALWIYAGVDLLDASPLMLAAVRGRAWTTDGPIDAASAGRLHGDGTPFDADALLALSLEQARQEMERIRIAIEAGELRALVERRVTSDPHAIAVLRRLDREHGYLESATPAHKVADVACMTGDSLWMPEVEHFRRRFQDDYLPPPSSDILVLLPCSARKPYRTSQSHRWFQRALDDSGVRHRCHEVMVTSPLGLVPRELEELYPANRYDVPVTGHWTRDEEMVIREQVLALLDRHDYKHVIAHVPASTFTFLRDILPENTIHTAHGPAAGKAACDKMRDHLRTLADPDVPGSREAYNRQKLEAVQGIASMQFGPDAAMELVDGGKAHGRWPYVKLDGPEGQRGMTTEGRALLSLSLHGAAAVARHRVKRVHIGDFQIKKTGSLFAVGVEDADDDVRAGDDVVVVHGDEVRAVGQALMSGNEMRTMKRGVAVSLRHVVKAVAPKAEVTA